ncbi:hypothetical protein DFH06DRAFT_1424005 [Mycena polygramma]|nr:hypothetical protein DFH06DRAFT_1424005 [Mycena polygramma]
MAGPLRSGSTESRTGNLNNICLSEGIHVHHSTIVTMDPDPADLLVDTPHRRQDDHDAVKPSRSESYNTRNIVLTSLNSKRSQPFSGDPASNFLSILAEFGDLSEKLKVTCIFELTEIVQYAWIRPATLSCAAPQKQVATATAIRSINTEIHYSAIWPWGRRKAVHQVPSQFWNVKTCSGMSLNSCKVSLRAQSRNEYKTTGVKKLTHWCGGAEIGGIVRQSRPTRHKKFGRTLDYAASNSESTRGIGGFEMIHSVVDVSSCPNSWLQIGSPPVVAIEYERNVPRNGPSLGLAMMKT